MSRLGRRNRTRWIKRMKRRGLKWFGGKLYQHFKWTATIVMGGVTYDGLLVSVDDRE